MENKEKKPRNQAAFPSGEYGGGMTLRDYFAAKAMESICVNAGRNGFFIQNEEIIAKQSYKLADAMLKERENE